MKATLATAVGFVLIIVFVFGFTTMGLEWRAHFKPKVANIERKTYEETQSYVHGKTGDLAKYFEEHQKNPEDRESIEALVKMNFADFDEKDIRNNKLRSFLVEVRGY